MLEKVSIYMTQEHSINVREVRLTQLKIYKFDSEDGDAIFIGGYSGDKKTIYVEGFKRSEDNPLVVLADEENEDNSFEAKEKYTVRLSYIIQCETSNSEGVIRQHESTKVVDFNVKISVSGKKYVKEFHSDVHDYTVAAKLEFKKVK